MTQQNQQEYYEYYEGQPGDQQQYYEGQPGDQQQYYEGQPGDQQQYYEYYEEQPGDQQQQYYEYYEEQPGQTVQPGQQPIQQPITQQIQQPIQQPGQQPIQQPIQGLPSIQKEQQQNLQPTIMQQQVSFTLQSTTTTHPDLPWVRGQPSSNKPHIEKAMDLLFQPMRGWITKQGGAKKSWKKRFAVLKPDNILYYYATERTSNPKGTINLAEAKSVRVSDEVERFLEIETQYRTFKFSLVDDDDLWKWYEAILRSITYCKAKGGTVSVSVKKSGYMKKQGGSIKSWKKRWFVLQGASLFYFKTESDQSPLGEIPLVDIKVKVISGKRHQFCLSHINRRTFQLRCTTDQERGLWIKMIREQVTSTENTDKLDLLLYDSKLVAKSREFSSFTLPNLTARISTWPQTIISNAQQFATILAGIAQPEACGVVFNALNKRGTGVTFNEAITAVITMSIGHPQDKADLIFSVLGNGKLNLIQLREVFSVWSRICGCYKLKVLSLLKRLRDNSEIPEEADDSQTFIESEQFGEIITKVDQFLQMFTIWDFYF